MSWRGYYERYSKTRQKIDNEEKKIQVEIFNNKKVITLYSLEYKVNLRAVLCKNH